MTLAPHSTGAGIFEQRFDMLASNVERVVRGKRQVVEWVFGLRFTEPPEPVAAAVARLNVEFRELRRQGAIRLPPPSDLPTARELLETARKHV